MSCGNSSPFVMSLTGRVYEFDSRHGFLECMTEREMLTRGCPYCFNPEIWARGYYGISVRHDSSAPKPQENHFIFERGISMFTDKEIIFLSISILLGSGILISVTEHIIKPFICWLLKVILICICFFLKFLELLPEFDYNRPRGGWENVDKF